MIGNALLYVVKKSGLTKRENRWKTAVLICYCLLISSGVARHEPWFDEAQAWLLARDTGPVSLVFRQMRYEGSPGLWHLILMIPAKLHLPYIFLNITSAVIAVISIYLFLFHSPFPSVIKLLYPFTFFAFYQYAVVARSYALIPLLLFLLAVIYESRLVKPYLFFTLLFLLSCISIHGLIIGFLLAIMHFFLLFRSTPRLDHMLFRKHLLSGIIFGAALLVLVISLLPPKDIISHASLKKDLTNYWSTGLSMFNDSITLSASSIPDEVDFLRLVPQLLTNLIIVFSLLWFQIRQKLMVFLFPAAGLFSLFTLVYANIWHQGVLFYLWLFVLWLSYHPQAAAPLRSSYVNTIRDVMTASLAIVLATQIYWSVCSYSFDNKNNYSGSKDLADYIKSSGLQDKKVFILDFYPVSVLPYFDGNIFDNFNSGKKPCFWLWSSRNDLYSQTHEFVEKEAPDYIIQTVKSFYGSEKYPSIPPSPIRGYKSLKIFTGSIFWKDRPYETDTYVLLERQAAK